MQGTSLAGHSVLIVEDEPLIALHIRTEFEKAGANAITVILSATPSVMSSRMVYQVWCLITARAARMVMPCAIT